MQLERTLTFTELQLAVGEWSKGNFGVENVSKITGHPLFSQNSLTGLVEEVGELNGRTIKHHQGRSGYGPTPAGRAKYRKDRNDAIADILIFLADYACREGVVLHDVFEGTWLKIVSKRTVQATPEGQENWVAHSHENIEEVDTTGNMAGDPEHRPFLVNFAKEEKRKRDALEQNGNGWAEPRETPENKIQQISLSKEEAVGLRSLLAELLALVDGQPYARIAPRVAVYQKVLLGE
jgi:NTP pyrophosphatase (non-canonical NTP hydrolase)